MNISNTKSSWADMCDDEDILPPLPIHFGKNSVLSPSETHIDHINDIGKDVNTEFDKMQTSTTIDQPDVYYTKKKLEIETIKDIPENLNKEFIERENKYRKQNNSPSWRKNKNTKKNKAEEWQVVNNKNRRKNSNKCYTCFPRKKVTEHIIQKIDNVTFHHDMCNRNIIVATPYKCYSNIDNKSNNNDIGRMFKSVGEFCKNWNIKDYSVTYNQGIWQTHKHFHIKIKTHDYIINRMRNDHFRFLTYEKSLHKSP
jgi:hypothetical protein